jgi:endonuclease/exonuclease/phosphatase (EEP) superfamily protein YafD
MVGLIRLVLGLAALGTGLVAIAAWFGSLVPFFDLFNHFQAVLIGALVVLALLVFFGFSGSQWRGPFTGLLLLGLFCSALTVVPETIALFSPRPALPADGRPVLKLMTHNLFGLNYDMQRVAQVVADENPDIVAFQEYFPPQRARLPKLLAASYPYSAYCVGGKRANIALYSKLPFTQVNDGDCTTNLKDAARTSHILASFTLPNGQQFDVLTTHFDWPFPIERQQQQRDTIETAVQGVNGPLLLVGDFNSTPWSYAQRSFADEAGLDRQTHGIFTWPLRFSIKGWRDTLPFLPLDQVMTKGSVVVHEIHAAPSTGSDHLPLVVTFSIGGPIGTPAPTSGPGTGASNTPAP